MSESAQGLLKNEPTNRKCAEAFVSSGVGPGRKACLMWSLSEGCIYLRLEGSLKVTLSGQVRR